MKQRYVINIQNVDNLNNVAIDIAPFTILTGDSNSGKTVILNIIYGLMRLSKKIIQNGDKTSKEYSVCREFVRELKENKESYIDVEVGSIFCDFFNVSLLKNKEYFFNEVFNVSIENNYKRFENAQIFISNYRIFPRVYLVVDDYCDEITIEGDLVKIPTDILNDEEYVLELLCNKIIDDGFRDVSLTKPIFMPSGRSTFLCYSDVFKTLKYQNLSIADFINNIQNLDFDNQGVYYTIHKYIEDEILNGSITKDSYQGYLENIEIPICMASDFIREIAPLVLFLKSKEKFTSFFIEEIETHLNLKLQRSIASVLARIINSGTSIFMSTNSSVILDQLCNFLLLNNLNRNKITGYGYVLSEVLDINNVNIYEFSRTKEGVSVNKIPITYNGFSNLNEELFGDILRENLQFRFEMTEKN